MVAHNHTTHISFFTLEESPKIEGSTRKGAALFFYAPSAITSGQGSDVAGGADQPQEQEEHQQPHQNGRDHAGGHDPHSQQDQRQQDRSQYPRQQGVQGRAAAGIPLRAARQGRSHLLHPQIHYGDAQRHPQKRGSHGDDPGDLQERGQDTQDGTDDQCHGGAAAAAIAIT